MRIHDASEIARTLSMGPVEGRRAVRRNVIRRFRKGRIDQLTQRDLHYIRQARYIARVGRSVYDEFHTIGVPTMPDTNNLLPALQSFEHSARCVFGPEKVKADEDLQTVFLDLTHCDMLFAWKGDDSVVCVLLEGEPTREELTQLADLNFRTNMGVETAFLNGVRSGKNDNMAEQVQLAGFGLSRSEGPMSDV